MINNKLLLLLKKFSKKKLTRFQGFCYSPYHNKHNGVRSLIDYLVGRYPDFPPKFCSKKRLIKQLDLQSDSELALIFTYALRVMNDFLFIEEVSNDVPLRYTAVLKQLRAHHVFSLYDKHLNKIKKSTPNSTDGNIEELRAQYRLADEADKYHQLISSRKDDQSLQKKQLFLDYFFIAEKLKDAIEMRLREQILQVEFSQRMLLLTIDEVEGNWEEYLKVPIIIIYFQLYQLVTEGEESYYFAVFSSIKNNQINLPKTELTYIYNIVQNYCIGQINLNNKKFLRELLKLYQSELELDLLIENGVLIEWHYKNIVTTALRLGEINWTEEFIETYKNKLSPDAFENAYRFNCAALYHAKGEYDRVLDLLVRMEYSDLRYNLGAKALLLRTYYELGETDSLVSLSAAFKQFLKRNKLMSKNRKNAYFNLFLYTEKLAILRDEIPFQTQKKSQIKYAKNKKDITLAGAIFNQAWLEEKMLELFNEQLS